MPSDDPQIPESAVARSGKHGKHMLLISVSAQSQARALLSGLGRFEGAHVVVAGEEAAVRKEVVPGQLAEGERFPAVAMVGLARAGRETMKPGDLVVANELLVSGDPLAFPSAGILAGELRRSGFTVHVGRIVADDTVDDPTALASGVVDTSVYRADGAMGLVCVIADAQLADSQPQSTDDHPPPQSAGSSVATPDQRVVDDVLGGLGAVLLRWAGTVRPRRVLLAGPRSLCAGVERAIEIVERALELYPHPVYVRKQIVHNVHVVRNLEERGAIFVEEVDEVPDGAVLIFSAHGVSPAVREAARDRHLQVIDATCPLVTKVHAKARRFVKRGDTVVLIGHEGHEETEGTLGQIPGNIVLVTSAEDVATLDLPDPQQVAYVTQTTLAIDEAQTVVDELRARFPDVHEQGSEDICYATTNRQDAIRVVAEEVDLVLVVGSSNSSNSLRLVEIVERQGKAAYLIDDASDIECAWLNDVDTVGLTAGASAPAVLLNSVVENLRGLGSLQVLERIVTTEEIRFTLPKEVRRP